MKVIPETRVRTKLDVYVLMIELPLKTSNRQKFPVKKRKEREIEKES